MFCCCIVFHVPRAGLPKPEIKKDILIHDFIQSLTGKTLLLPWKNSNVTPRYFPRLTKRWFLESKKKPSMQPSFNIQFRALKPEVWRSHGWTVTHERMRTDIIWVHQVLSPGHRACRVLPQIVESPCRGLNSAQARDFDVSYLIWGNKKKKILGSHGSGE